MSSSFIQPNASCFYPALLGSRLIQNINVEKDKLLQFPPQKQTAKAHSENIDEVVQKELCLWNV